MSSSPPSQRRPDWTILEVLGWTTQRFTERGLSTPRLDAELLIAHALDARRIDLYVRSNELLTGERLAAIRDVVRRRQEGESVAYITGEKEFWGLPYKVTPDVLVPRPDTETLVEALLERLPKDRPATVVDIGTGSGAIAVAVAKARPQAKVWATDQSAAALDVARGNAARNGVEISFHQGHLLAPVASHRPFDFVVANLPYIPTADIATLSLEVNREPRAALDGGPDGLDLIRELVAAAPAHLQPGGLLLLELGQGQAHAVVQACLAAGLEAPFVCKDLGGIERVVGARAST
ncbi:MAG: peptide chain release factor N(5)-glutamine methyltransferase [Myxococcales bacterium]|nr:peptide chain release factor N(5)-glutamine methyltransferase [Myxococcales bacterium]